ncbi:unnamed protein product, partial [Rotaria sp. Silwood1]
VINPVEENKEEILEEYDQSSAQEAIRLAAIKQQAIILSEKINELSHLFRVHLRNDKY